MQGPELEHELRLYEPSRYLISRGRWWLLGVSRLAVAHSQARRSDLYGISSVWVRLWSATVLRILAIGAGIVEPPALELALRLPPVVHKKSVLLQTQGQSGWSRPITASGCLIQFLHWFQYLQLR